MTKYTKLEMMKRNIDTNMMYRLSGLSSSNNTTPSESNTKHIIFKYLNITPHYQIRLQCIESMSGQVEFIMNIASDPCLDSIVELKCERLSEAIFACNDNIRNAKTYSESIPITKISIENSEWARTYVAQRKYSRTHWTDLVKSYEELQDWISPTSLRMPLLNDHFGMWAQYHQPTGMPTIEDSIDPFLEEILESGHTYEAKIVCLMANKANTLKLEHKTHEKHISSIDLVSDPIFTYAKAMESFKIIEKYPVHFQPFLCNYEKRMYGYADIVIRGDALVKIFAGRFPKILDIVPELYYVIDVKHSSLEANKDSYLSKSARMMPYRVQLWMYREMLEDAGINMGQETFLLNNACELIPVKPPIESELKVKSDAINWVREMRQNGNTWKPNCRPELFPNVKVTGLSRNVEAYKKRVASDTKDPILLWNMTATKRRKLAESGINDYTDPELTAEHVYGHKDSLSKRTFNSILRSNQENTIVNDEEATLPYSEKKAVYMDIETTRRLETGDEIMFMIGWTSNFDNKGTTDRFCQLHAKELDYEHEREITKQFLLSLKKNKVRVIYHWAPFEETFFDKLAKKYTGLPWHVMDRIQFFDVCKWLRESNIAFPGATNYSLKSIGKALFDNKYIKTTWDNSETSINDGLSALNSATEYYSSRDEGIINSIKGYNRSDVCVMKEICDLVSDNC